MSDWVHCNSCFNLPSSSSQKFLLTSCGHVFCAKCISSGSKTKCVVCNQQCNVLEINRQMKSDVQQYFLDPVEVAKKQQKQLSQIINFQKSQRDRLMMHFRGQNKKFHQMGEFFQKEMSRKQELNKELAALKEENRQLKQNLQSQTFSKLPASSMNLYRVPFTPNTIGSVSTKRISPFVKMSSETNSSMAPPSAVHLAHSSLIRSDNSARNTNVLMSAGLTTPRMLGLDKNENNQRQMQSSNPYDGAWPGSNGRSPMTVSPCMGTTPANNSFIQQIKLPFRLNANSLPR